MRFKPGDLVWARTHGCSGTGTIWQPGEVVAIDRREAHCRRCDALVIADYEVHLPDVASVPVIGHSRWLPERDLRPRDIKGELTEDELLACLNVSQDVSQFEKA